MKKNVKLWFDPLSALGESREANLLTNSGSATGSNANCLNGCHDRAHRDQWLNVLCPDVTPMPYNLASFECERISARTSTATIYARYRCISENRNS